MKQMYKHLFFDLDHTLWDFDNNCTDTLLELFELHKLQEVLRCNFHLFQRHYLKVNAQMWAKYNKKLISKEEMRLLRFHLVLFRFGVNNNKLATLLENEYLATCPKKGKLIKGTIEILNYLHPKYTLHILTNGFQETQETKLKHAHIDHFFSHMTTSESCGFTKPNPHFFKHHLKLINATPSECIMIGDNINTDIRGASASKIDSILFDPSNSDQFMKGKQDYVITELSQLRKII